MLGLGLALGWERLAVWSRNIGMRVGCSRLRRGSG